MALLSSVPFARGPSINVLSSERHVVVVPAPFIPHYSGLRTLPISSESRLRVGRAFALNCRTRRRGVLQVVAVFERYTERAIKAVMLAQQEAKLLGSAEVPALSGCEICVQCTHHLVGNGQRRQQMLQESCNLHDLYHESCAVFIDVPGEGGRTVLKTLVVGCRLIVTISSWASSLKKNPVFLELV